MPRQYRAEWDRRSREWLEAHPYCSACHVNAGEVVRDRHGADRVIRLTVDHRNGNGADWSDENLRTLCDVCHGRLTAAGFLHR